MKVATLSFDDGGPADLAVLKLLGEHDLPATVYLVVDRVADMDPEVYRGFEVGSHTLTHPKMCDCDSKQLREEIAHCRELLQCFSGRKPLGIAWPGGGYVARCAIEAQAAGYAYGRGFYETTGDPRKVGAPWNRGISVKFQDQIWAPIGEDVHLVAHPAVMDLRAFETTLRLMIEAGYIFLSNAEFFNVP